MTTNYSNCSICTIPKKYFYYSNCYDDKHHPICTKCYKKWIFESLESNNIPTCMECKEQLQPDFIKSIMSPARWAKYLDLALKVNLNRSENIFNCPGTDCPGIFFYENKNLDRVFCNECKKDYCLQCKVFWHIDETCVEYQERMKRLGSTDPNQQSELLIQQESKPCPKCKTRMTKLGGCMHMVCAKCKYNFHWVTGENWKTHKIDFDLPMEYTDPEETKFNPKQADQINEAEDASRLSRLIEQQRQLPRHMRSLMQIVPIIHTRMATLADFFPALDQNTISALQRVYGFK